MAVHHALQDDPEPCGRRRLGGRQGHRQCRHAAADAGRLCSRMAVVARGRAMIALFIAAAVSAAEPPRSILFVGNSFTFGAMSDVMTYRKDSVSDLNGDGMGGVPALFRRFADEAGLHYEVSLETAAGQTLTWHLANKRGVIDRRWDAVVLQEYSTLDPDKPGDVTATIAAARSLT